MEHITANNENNLTQQRANANTLLQSIQNFNTSSNDLATSNNRSNVSLAGNSSSKFAELVQAAVLQQQQHNRNTTNGNMPHSITSYFKMLKINLLNKFKIFFIINNFVFLYLSQSKVLIF